MGDAGEYCPSLEQVITTEAECQAAYSALDLPMDPYRDILLINHPLYLAGCSVREDLALPVFNAYLETFGGADDLFRPLCFSFQGETSTSKIFHIRHSRVKIQY